MRQRAFSLIELVILLALLGVFMLVGSRLFAHSMGLSRDAAAHERTVARVDHLLRELRRDVWSARSIDIDEDQTVRLEQPGDGSVRWSVQTTDDGATVQRNDERAITIPAPLTFEAVDGGDALRVTIGRQPAVLVSQQRLMTEGGGR